MCDEKKCEGTEYAQISQECVRLCAEDVGMQKCDDYAFPLIAEDVNYRLREALQCTSQFMRHAKRKKLSSADFNDALRWSDVDALYGHSCLEQNTFYLLKEADAFCVEDHEVNLTSFWNGNHVIDLPEECALKAQWLAVEGTLKDVSAAPGHVKKSECTSQAISEDHMSYYDKVSKAILSNDEQLVKAALKDLRTDSKISPLLPYFINFFSVGVKKVSYDPTQLHKLLHTVHALTANSCLYLGSQPFLKMLVQGILYCIVEPLAASINPVNDHWALRDYAAQILARIVRIWHTSVNQLRQHVLVSVEEVFKDLTKPFSSHYGAIITLTALGPVAIEESIIPNMPHYWCHLQTTVNDSAYCNMQIKADAHKVYGALLIAAEIAVLRYHCILCQSNGVCEGLDKVQESLMDTDVAEHFKEILHRKSVVTNAPTTFLQCSCDFYLLLNEYFGDALAARLPCVYVRNFYTPMRRSFSDCLFVTREPAMSGEQLLEAFELREDELQSYSGEDEHSDEDVSLVSDDAELEQEPDSEEKNVDLRIKSTVSDPALGIKLTIAKLPRTQLLAPVKIDQTKKHLARKLNIKISKDQLQAQSTRQRFFEIVPLKTRYPTIDLTFEGSMPVSTELLKRKSFNLKYLAEKSECLRLHLMHNNFKAHGLLRFKSCKERLRIASKTGNVFSII